jgi:hypothetical protein
MPALLQALRDLSQPPPEIVWIPQIILIFSSAPVHVSIIVKLNFFQDFGDICIFPILVRFRVRCVTKFHYND